MDNELKEQWDNVAEDYQRVFTLGQNDYNRSLLQFLEKECGLRPGIRVIDVGCGVGKYGVYFAGMGCDVTLTDISPEMLRMAEKNMSKFDTPWTVYLADFAEITGNEEVFAKGFDLSISTMSPAICSLETVKKYSAMTHGTCFTARFYDWKQPFRDRMAEMVGAVVEPRMTGLKEDCQQLAKDVKEAGFEPSVKIVEYNWEDRRSPEEEIAYLFRHDFKDLSDTEAAKAKAEEAIKSLTEDDGMVTDNVNTLVAWIYWKTE